MVCGFFLKDVSMQLLFFYQFVLEYSCFKMLLVSAVQQNVSATHIHISPFFWILFPFRSPQSIEPSSLCYTVGYH